MELPMAPPGNGAHDSARAAVGGACVHRIGAANLARYRHLLDDRGGGEHAALLLRSGCAGRTGQKGQEHGLFHEGFLRQFTHNARWVPRVEPVCLPRVSGCVKLGKEMRK